MIFLHGVYRFSKKRVGFRNDYCSHCRQQGIAAQYRTFNMWHFFFVPLIPLGYASSWQCKQCGADPRQYTESPAVLKLGLLVFGVVGLVMLGASPFQPRDRLMMAGIGCAMLLGAFGLAMMLKHQSRELETHDVPPNTDVQCPFCKGEIAGEPAHCGDCGVRRL